MAFTNIYCVGGTLSRRMRWVGNVAPIGEKEVHTGFWWGKSEGKRPCGRSRHI